MEETNEELPNFSIGIDLLGPDPTSNKNKAEKNSQVAHFANLLEDQLSDTWVHLALILILSFSLTIIGWLDEMYSLKQKYKMWRVFDQPIGTFVYFFLRVVRILHSMTIKGFFAQILVVLSKLSACIHNSMYVR